MNQTDVLDLVREGLMTALIIAGPVMIVGLVVGVLVSLFQTLTQLNEMTLAFIPKILAIFVALLIFGPFMLQQLESFMRMTTDKIVSLP
ncbi:flagellar biosynthesis protein FliQ [Roseiterribacter gracilis]|uniref:Flagellar biosynthetic protein FliQ n=1 Tax=Roseiterribacter gracilis TaxID=2812848 RepID=A0A8S8XHM9_9PROT|nr:flagellar export apparatus protein FliQ [Rhodospirillales bacterium TMPK1]